MSDAEVGARQVEQQLARELLAIQLESYGRGAERAVVRLFDALVVALLDGLELLPHEQLLVGAGEGETVVGIRSRYEQAIESTFRAAVERATGRRVVSFASVTKLEPTYAVELFRLAPRTTAMPEQPAGD